MIDFLERHSVAIHLAVIALGVVAFIVAFVTGIWQLLAISVFSYWFTVYT